MEPKPHSKSVTTTKSSATPADLGDLYAGLSAEVRALAGLSMLISDFDIASKISARIGAPFMIGQEASIVTKAEQAITTVGKVNRGAAVDTQERESAKSALVDFVALLERLEPKIAANFDHYNETAVALFRACSAEFGCSGGSAISLLTDPELRQHLLIGTNAVVKFLDFTSELVTDRKIPS